MMHLLLLLLLTQDEVECGSSRCRPLRDAGCDPEVRSILDSYQIRDREFSWQLRKLKGASKKAALHELDFPSPLPGSTKENNTVRAKYWVPVDEEKRHAAVVLIHWLGGSFQALELVAHRLAENGICALMIWLPHYGKRQGPDKEKMLTLSMEKTVENFRQAALDVRRAGDWLASRREVDPGRIGILGISLGALVGSLAYGIDTNFTRAVFVIGGGDLAEIVMHDSKETREFKAELEKAGYTPEKLRREWRGIEPLTFAHRARTDSVLMFNAEDDEIIPKASTMRLHEALGRPSLEWFKGGHYAVVTQLGAILKKSTDHLKSRPFYVEPQPPVVQDPPRIRVLVAEDESSLAIEIETGLVVFKAGTDKQLLELGRFKGTASCSGGRISLGADALEEGNILVVPRKSGALKADKHFYHGSLLLVPAKAGKFHAVNVLDLERYVMGVLGPEIGKDAPIEAQRAQAVCARTYAYVTMVGRKDEVFDVFSDVRDQVYRGVPKDPIYERAVNDTKGELLFYKEKPVRTYFSSTCGGTTESVFDWRKEKEIEPLAGGACGFCADAKWYSWTTRLAPEDIAKAFKKELGGQGVAEVRVKSRTKSGRAREVAVTRTDGTEVAIGAPDFRAGLGYDKFRSTKFNVRREGSVLLFKGNGWGHGVGLCQEGAIGMAKAGKTYKQILRRYYPGATIEKK